MKTVLFEVGGSFRPVDEETPFELIAGIRVIGMDLDVDVELPTPPGGEFDFGSSDELVDVFAGARFMAPLGERFFFAVRGDVGTGDTDFTWNVQGTLGLQFGQQGRYAALLGYRHMEIELKETAEGVKIETDMTMSGPMAGFLFRF